MSDEQKYAVVTVTIDGVTWTFPKAKVELASCRRFGTGRELGDEYYTLTATSHSPYFHGTTTHDFEGRSVTG